jgi:alkanesulfonate monooxygenase SsuD/methylene tetrahydromethanopterin reductase-like flavin-dependent oxidoreductase (luciferase family)
LPSASSMVDFCSPVERASVDSALACAVIGAPDTVAAGLQAFVDRHHPDELLLTANIFDHAARLRSFKLAMQAGRSIKSKLGAPDAV